MGLATEVDVTGLGVAGSIASYRPRVLWLALGTALSLLAVGGRWDIALAAWIAPVFLLRFSRTSAVAAAIAGIAIASSLQMAWCLFEGGARLNIGARIGTGLFFGALGAIPYGLDRLLAARLTVLGRIFLFPVVTVALEFGVASLLPIGESNGARVTTQGESLALLQIISLLGPYVIGFLIACAATIVNHLWENPTPRVLVGYAGSLLAGMLCIVAYGQARLAYTSWDAPIETVKIAGVIPPMALREPANEGVSMEERRALYAQLQADLIADTRAAARAGAKIVAWSEAAAELLEADKGPFLEKVAAVAREEQVYVNAAIMVPSQRNETFLIGPDGSRLWHYRKNQTVPGRESVAPFENAPPVVQTPFGRLTNVICYDADFPGLSRVAADIMLLPAWDWSEAGYMHTMKVARLRAIENGYSMIRVDYDGVSGAFDQYGRALVTQNTFRGGKYTMMVDLPVAGVSTLYNRIGDVFAWLCVVLTLALCARGVLRPVPRDSNS